LYVVNVGDFEGACVGEVNVGARVGEFVVPVGEVVGENESPTRVGPTEGAYDGRVGLPVGE
jgi:hypothetical protein